MTSRNVPRLRFKGFGDEWKLNKLGNICKIKMGQSPHSKNYTSDSKHDILVQGNADLFNGTVNPRIYTTETTRTANKNDIIMTVRAPVGELAVNQFENVVLGRGVAALEGNKFIYNNLKKVDMDNKWNRLSSGSTFKAVNSDDIKSLNVKIPSLSEQQHIGNFFSKLDHLIDLHSQKLEQLKKLKRGYLQKMFPQKGETVPRLRFSGFSGEWKKVKLSDYFEYKNGHSLEKKVVHGGQINVINLNSIGMDGKLKDSGKYINNDDTEKLEKNDIIMILSDITHGNLIGITAIIPSNDKYVLNQRVGLLRKQKTKDINQKFVHYLLNSDRKYFQRMCAGMSQLNLSKKDVIDYTFLLPSLEEQIKIAKLLVSIDNLIDMENKKIMQLRQQKKAYLQKMFI